MSSSENLCARSVTVSKIPKKCQKDDIVGFVKSNLIGHILDAEEVCGIEEDSSLTRWVLLFQTIEDVKKLIEMREAEMNYEDNSYMIVYQKTIPCEIPERWEEEIKVQRGKPPVPQKRGPISHHLPQHVGQYGMVSGFYENVPGSDGHHPAPGGNIGGDPNITGNPGQQQFAPGGMAYPQQQGYPYPGYGYPQNVDPAQQNIPPGDHGIPHGQQNYPGFGYPPNMDPNQQNIPPGDHDIPHGQQHYPGFGYPPNMDPNQQNIPPGDQGVPQGQQGFYQHPQLPPGMMPWIDQNTGRVFLVPIPGYASQSDAAHSYPGQVDQVSGERRPHMQPGPPQGPPPPYAEQMFGFNPQNRTEQKVPLESKDGPVVSSKAIDDQQGMEDKIAQSTTQPIEEEHYRQDDSSREEDQPEQDDGAEQPIPKLIVTNIPSTVDVDYIEWFFERKKNFGGLDIQDVIYNEEDACAIVEFGSSEDVDAVLERVPVKMKGKEVEVQRYEPEPEEPIDPCTVLVSGPESVLSDIETLEYYFESKRRSGGGDIADIKYDEDLIVVVITFEEEEDAQRVIEKTDHKVNKQAITVEQYKPMKRNVPVHRETPASDDDFEDAKEVILDTVKISGVTAPIRSTAELYFENSKRSGGGDYDKCWSDPDEEGVIFIKFNNLEDAQKVLERDHEVKGKRLTVESYVKETVSAPKPPEQKADPESDEEIIYDTVKVVGVDLSKRSTVELYFENKRRSGGGEYQTIWSDEEEEGVIYIKYCSVEVAKNVASRSHKVEKCELKVKLYTPPKPPPSYDNKILIKGLKETTSQDGLFNFIEAKSGFIPESLDYHETEPGVVMVTFESKPDFNKLENIFQKYKLEGSSLKLAPVAISNCIMVSELPERITQDTVHFYFENQRKSGGGDVDKVTMNDDDTCLVYFVDYTVIDNVLERKHTLSKQTVVVQRYQECLGRPEGDVKDRKLKIPDSILLNDVDKNKVKYLNQSDTNRRTLEEQLQALHCKICWPNDGEDVRLDCTLTQSVDGCFRLAKTWKKDVLAVVVTFMGNIVVVKTEVLQDAWKNVIQKLGEVTIDNPQSLALFVDTKQYSITIVGTKDVVTTLKTKIDSLVKEVMDDMERERQKVKEVINNLKPIETKMLLAEKFPDQMEKKFKIQMKISIKSKNEIVVEGPSGDVRDAKLEMYEVKNRYVCKKFDSVPKLSLQLYRFQQTKDYIVKQLKIKRFTAVWDDDGSSLQICSTEEHFDESCSIVRNSVKDTFIKLENEQASLANSEKWKTVILEVQKANPGKCLITDEDRKIIVCCTDDIFDDNVDQVRRFFRLNTILTEKVSCTKEAHRLIKKHHSSEVDKIAKELAEYNVQIVLSAQYGTFEIKGTIDGIKKAKSKLQELLRRVQRRDHDIEKPGLDEYIRTPKGRDNLHTVESSFPVVVSARDDDDDDDDDVSGFDDHDDEGSRMNGMDVYASGKLYDCRDIYCGKGDMTEMDVDVLVNSTNEKINLTGGLGKVILRKGGKQIEKECKDYIRGANRLGDGEAFVSSAGNLRAKRIVHIRGPAWKGGANDEADMLEEAVFKCMQMASSAVCTSIAIPAISCGAFGYPVQRATSTIVEAVKNYFREDQDSNVNKVFLCDVKAETVEAFSAAMVTHIGSTVKVMAKKEPQSSKRPVPKKRMPKFDDSDDDEGAGARWKPAGGKRVLPKFSRGSKTKLADDSVSINGVTITLVKAEIAREKVDMIVNTTAKNLDLKNGAVSISLLKAAGSSLQDELFKNYPNGIKDGETATTSGYKLKCSHVVHTSLSTYDQKNPGLSKTILRRLMKNCLDEAENQGVSSIAFPAIGTGNLNYPKDLVALEMFQAVANFTFSSLTDVKFIVYQRDTATIEAFTAELKTRQSPGGATARRSYSDSDDDDNATLLSSTGLISSAFNEELSDAHFVSDADEEVYEDVDYSGGSDGGQIIVTVKQGDITKDDADCIVNSTNEELDLSKGAVSKSLIKTGGKKLEQALSKLKNEMKKKHLVVTDAPNMNCKHIIHIKAVDTIEEWKSVVFKCLEAADQCKSKSIAFPALGTGLRMKASQMAPVMMEAVTHFESSEPAHLTDVRFVVFQDSMVSDFKKVVGQQKQGGGRASGPLQSASGRPNRPGPKGRARRSHPDRVTFVIRSLEVSKINDAIKKLEFIFDKEIQQQCFNDSIIKMLDDTQKQEVQQIANRHQLKLDLNRSSGNLVIQGLTAKVNAAANDIHTMLRKVQSDEKDKQAADLMVNLVRWYYIEITDHGQNLQEYEKGLNYKIESAYKANSNNIAFVADDKKYIIDFNGMIEYPEGNMKDSIAVIRRDLVKQGNVELPAEWTDFSGNQKVVVLQPTDGDYQRMEATFLPSAGAGFTVTKIERIMNKTLWTQYQAKKKQLDDQNPKGTKNEQLLWHGTAPEAVDNINAHGFNRSYCGKNATVYGDGVYFAVNANYPASDTYSRPDPAGVKRMYYCLVLTGEFTSGTRGMRVAPKKGTGDSTALYDSVVDRPGGPGMYIIFHDTQAYPEYLISFKKT